MKAKFTVSVVKETPIEEIIDETFAKEVFSSITQLKMNSFEYSLRSELKISKDRLSLKHNRKWFNKHKYIKFGEIKRFFLSSLAQEYILMCVSIDDFYGYIVLKIEIAGHMIALVEELKKSVNYTDIDPTIVRLSNGDRHSTEDEIVTIEVSEKEIDDMFSLTCTEKENGDILSVNIEYTTEPQMLNVSGSPNLDTVDAHEDYDHYPEDLLTLTGEPSIKSFKSRVYRGSWVGKFVGKKIVIDRNESDNLTFVNSNTKEVVVEDGPISLYSHTYPSIYNRNNLEEPDYWDCVESESESESYSIDHSIF